MQWSTIAEDTHRITGMRHRIEDEESVLTWHWPEHIQFVYIYLFPDGEELPLADRPLQAMKLLTREEYKAMTGYRRRVDGIGRYAFRVYPCDRGPEGLVLLLQEDEDNIVRFSSGKARIRCSIRYGFGLFRKRRSVTIELESESAIPKEALCYVTKAGTAPLHAEDGTAYPLIEDIVPGRNVLPKFEIPRDHRVRLFFTNGRLYGERYELIQE